MTTQPWLERLVSDGVVDAPGRTNAEARDALMAAARTSLADATRDPERSPGGIIRDTENAVRQAVSALAAHHGTRIIGQNKHAAVVRFAEAHPGFDDSSADKVDQIRLARNAGMYGNDYEGTPTEYTVEDAAILVKAGTNVLNRVSTLLNAGRPIPPPPNS